MPRIQMLRQSLRPKTHQTSTTHLRSNSEEDRKVQDLPWELPSSDFIAKGAAAAIARFKHRPGHSASLLAGVASESIRAVTHIGGSVLFETSARLAASSSHDAERN